MNTKQAESESALERLRTDMANWKVELANWKTDMVDRENRIITATLIAVGGATAFLSVVIVAAAFITSQQ